MDLHAGVLTTNAGAVTKPVACLAVDREPLNGQPCQTSKERIHLVLHHLDVQGGVSGGVTSRRSFPFSSENRKGILSPGTGGRLA